MNTRPTLTNRHRSLGGLLFALTLLAASSPPACAEDELGRLFFTPERRQILDRQRELNIQETQAIPEEPTFTINGVVTRSSGKKTTWINGVAQSERSESPDISIVPHRNDPSRVFVQPSQGPAANARVGETVNRSTGETENLLGGGSISRHPRGRSGH